MRSDTIFICNDNEERERCGGMANNVVVVHSWGTGTGEEENWRTAVQREPSSPFAKAKREQCEG